MVYSVPYDSWLRHGWGLAVDGLQCTIQFMAETRWVCYDMVYSVQCNSWINHGLVCSDMVYSIAYDSWLRHGWGLAADSLHCTTHGWDTKGLFWYGLQCTEWLMIEAWLGPDSGWFTVYYTTHVWEMKGLFWYGLQCTEWLMVEAWLGPGSGWFTVYITTHVWETKGLLWYGLQCMFNATHGLTTICLF
jgi:hypothetical protein